MGALRLRLPEVMEHTGLKYQAVAQAVKRFEQAPAHDRDRKGLRNEIETPNVNNLDATPLPPQIDNVDQDVLKGADALWLCLQNNKGVMRAYFYDRIGTEQDNENGVNWITLAQESNVAISQDMKEVGKAAAEAYMQAIQIVVPASGVAFDLVDLTEGNWTAALGFVDKVPFGLLKNVTVKAGGNVICAFRGGCFGAGTMVHTPDGMRPIESLRVGDPVLSYNQETGEIVTQKIRQVVRNVGIETTTWEIGGESIVTTPNHVVWSEEQGWIPVALWDKDNHVRLLDGTVAQAAIRETRAIETVYNFEVEGNHNYFVGERGVLVHNGCLTASMRNYLKQYGLRGNSAELRAALIQLYQSTGRVIPEGAAAHHIVSFTHKLAQDARVVLVRVGLNNPNDVMNGVLLPGSKAKKKSFWSKIVGMGDAANHAAVHNQDYYNEVTRRLQSIVEPGIQYTPAELAAKKVDVELALRQIAAELQFGTFPGSR